MLQRRATRISRELAQAEQERLAEYRKQIAEELPDLQARDQMRKDARQESTLSGELRRTVHASDLSLAEIATRRNHADYARRFSDRRTHLAF